MVCPFCGAKGKCVPHGSYRRSLIDKEGDKTVYDRVEIKRVRCTGCEHTHAILPDYIVPYTTYSLLFILRVLCVYFRRRPVERICQGFSITPAMLYRWKALFLAHKEIWLGMLRSAETAPEHFLHWLFRVPDYAASFAAPFFFKTARSFLQKHRDATFSRHAVF